MNRPPSQSLLGQSLLGKSLLGANDPPPVRILNPTNASTFLLIGDHAGNAVPAGLQSLGLGSADLARHIGWDIGIAGLGEALSGALDTTFIHQSYSRLVIDCNRAPDAVDAMPEVSDGTTIPGNTALSNADRAARVDAIHTPYQNGIAQELERRAALGRDTVLVSLHSFTPRLFGIARPWQIGVLHGGGNLAFAHAVLAGLQAHGGWTVGDNEPYAMDGIDYTIPYHAFAAGLRYVELEIRQDLLATAEQQAGWARDLAPVLLRAL